MSWNIEGTSGPSWAGTPEDIAQLQELYNTATPGIGITLGNEIPLPTSYSGLNITTLSTDLISLSGNSLTALNSVLYLNGTAIATGGGGGGGILETATWALFKAISNVNLNEKNLMNVNELSANDATLDNMYSIEATFGTVTMNSLTTDQGNVTSLRATNALIDTCDALVLAANSSTLQTCTMNSGTITSLKTSSIQNSGTITTNQLTAQNGNIMQLQAGELQATSATIPTLQANIATLNVLTAPSATITNLTASNVTIDQVINTPSIHTTNATIDNTLNAGVVNALFGNIGILQTTSISNSTDITTDALTAVLTSTSTLSANNITTDNFTATTADVTTSNLNNVNVNSGINFIGYGGSMNGMYYNNILHGNQYLNDINNMRNGQFNNINIVSMWNGDTVIPPYQTGCTLTVGDANPLTNMSQAVVTFNGLNNLYDDTLTVNGTSSFRGGIKCYPLNTGLNALDVYGFSYLNGDCNVTGIFNALGISNLEGSVNIGANLTVAGTAEILTAMIVAGAIQASGAVNIDGLLTCTGDIGIGTSSLTNGSFDVYYNTDFHNGIDLHGTDVNNVRKLTIQNQNDGSKQYVLSVLNTPNSIVGPSSELYVNGQRFLRSNNSSGFDYLSGRSLQLLDTSSGHNMVLSSWYDDVYVAVYNSDNTPIGSATPLAGSWSKWKAGQDVDMNEKNLTNANEITCNALYLSVPDSTDFAYVRWTDRLVYKATPDSPYQDVASDWWRSPPNSEFSLEWGNQSLGLGTLTLNNFDDGSSTFSIKAKNFQYVTGGDVYSDLHINEKPFLYDNGASFNVLRLQSAQFVDTDYPHLTNLFVWLDQLYVDVCDTENNLLDRKAVLSDWASYPAKSDVDLSDKTLTMAGVRQPLTQFGTDTLNSFGNCMITLPLAYASSTDYVVQLTYVANLGGYSMPIAQSFTKSSSTFSVQGQPGSQFNWTTHGYN